MSPRAPWWRGARGEWYVVAQLTLMAALFLGPRTVRALPPWPAALATVCTVVGGALFALGGALLLASLVRLGQRNLTPLPHPRDHAALVVSGPYRLVRHPMYAGGIALALGWALLMRGWLTLVEAAALLVLFEFKSRREERWLMARFPGYADYRRRVRRLIPFVH